MQQDSAVHIEERVFKPAGMDGAIREIHSPTKQRPECFEISEDGVGTRVESIYTIMEHKGRLGFWVDHDQETGAVAGYGHLECPLFC